MKYIVVLVIIALIAIPLASYFSELGKAQSAVMLEKSYQDARDREQRRAFWEQVNQVILTVVPVVAWSVAGGLVVLSIALALVVSRTAWQLGNAAGERARRQANLIYLDPKTRQFPIFTVQTPTGAALVNPNAGQVLLLSEGHEPVKIMAAGSMYTQAAGAIAQEAASARDALGVASVKPPLLIEAEYCGDS